MTDETRRVDDAPISRHEFEQRISEVPPLVDPTINVLQLVAAAITRQDDLREAESEHREALSAMRDKYEQLLREAESRRIDASALAEGRRIDSLLAASKSDVSLASSRAELTASALAERVDTSAKTLATSVETTAKALATTFDVTTKALMDRIVPLEQARYEQAGGKEQRGESRQSNQWTFQQAVTIISIGLGGLYFILNSMP